MNNAYLNNLFGLNDKVAMVTGGHTGIGRAISMALAQAGSDVFILTHSDKNIDEIRSEIQNLGRRVEFGKADLSNEEQAMKSVDQCINSFGKIDILVNNAGTIRRAPLLEGDNQSWKDVIDLNLSAVYYLSKQAAKYMVNQNSGKIINIASMLSFQGGKFVPSYTASKHGVAGITKSFANELAQSNIQINAIAPGYIETANTELIRANKERSSEILSRIPANRWGNPNDLGATAVFLSSKASDYINGHVLCVDGGWMVR